MRRPTGVCHTVRASDYSWHHEFLGGIAALGLAGVATAEGSSTYVPPTTLAVANIIVGAFELIIGYGLWGLRGWAWLIAIVVAIVNIITTIPHLFGSLWLGAIFGLLITGIVLWYLFQPEVKQAFGRS